MTFTLKSAAAITAFAIALSPAAALAHHGWSATVEGYVYRASQDEMRAEWICLGDTRTQLR